MTLSIVLCARKKERREDENGVGRSCALCVPMWCVGVDVDVSVMMVFLSSSRQPKVGQQRGRGGRKQRQCRGATLHPLSLSASRQLLCPLCLHSLLFSLFTHSRLFLTSNFFLYSHPVQSMPNRHPSSSSSSPHSPLCLFFS